MNISQSSEQLRALIIKYENHNISIDEYHQQRKILLDALDKQFNGIESIQLEQPLVNSVEAQPPADKTQPYFASKIEQCMSFLTGANEK